MTQTKQRMVVTLATVGIGLAGLVGCSSAPSPHDASQASTLPSASVAPTSAAHADPALCTAAAEFQTAVKNVAALNAGAVGVPGVKAALQKLDTSGADLANAAQTQFPSQIADLRQAVDSFKATVNGLNDQASLSSNVGALVSSATTVGLAAGNIMGSVKQSCPAPSSAAPAPPVAPTS
ncbi:MAG: hypothetical protein ACRDSP_19330 [Pseudonocardiaceae bacterium]